MGDVPIFVITEAVCVTLWAVLRHIFIIHVLECVFARLEWSKVM